ncbi:hypothetical protein TSAR_006896 [Trichomalopsis sarcophagae]|uniref:Uncharacterized protein n=1 Tax=Trichomalopsis sarcophagae TaxID=543379 RepID=A0A232EDL0_9HYME|nr:hypothetical protein TSAR_006896 [Trichomalopsis sarcophagae]
MGLRLPNCSRKPENIRFSDFNFTYYFCHDTFSCHLLSASVSSKYSHNIMSWTEHREKQY